MSTLKVNTIQDTSGGSGFTPSSVGDGLIKCWVNFRGGNGNTTGINDSLGVSSITDNGTGHYFINFSANFANINYCIIIGNIGIFIELINCIVKCIRHWLNMRFIKATIRHILFMNQIKFQ